MALISAATPKSAARTEIEGRAQEDRLTQKERSFEGETYTNVLSKQYRGCINDKVCGCGMKVQQIPTDPV